jgi:hypothetical protein
MLPDLVVEKGSETASALPSPEIATENPNIDCFASTDVGGLRVCSTE